MPTDPSSNPEVAKRQCQSATKARRRKVAERKLAMTDKESKSGNEVSEEATIVKKEKVVVKEEPVDIRYSDNVDFMDEDSDGKWP